MTSISKTNTKLTVDGNRFSLLKEDKRLGWAGMGLSIETTAGVESLVVDSVAEAGEALLVKGSYPKSQVAETVRLTLTDNGGLIVERELGNAGDYSVSILDACIGRVDGCGGPVFVRASIWRLRLAHMDNLRLEKFPWCRPDAPYIKTVPLQPTWYGNQENQALPVMMLMDQDLGELLLEGQLVQERTRARWQLAAAPDNRNLLAEYKLSWEMVGGALLQAGETLTLEPVYYEIVEATHPQYAWNNYFDELTARNSFRTGNNILHSKAFYCSWNYGIMQNFTEESLVKTAKFIGENLPEVEFFLIDGGWQGREAISGWDCANFYLPENQWCNLEKLPSGMAGFARRISECGLRPAIWWTPSVNLSSTLVKEHPEWLAKDAAGAVFRIAQSGYLDVSLPEARAYLEKVWDIIFNRWGYQAMKMDFWCHMFESGHIRFATGAPMQWRDWLLGALRSYIPDDGFLMTCVAVAQGNVHLGKHAETYRCCIDVGNGAWHEHPLASCWIQPLLSIPGRRTTLLNADGFGVNEALSDDENLHRLTYGFITMGSLEVDGRIEELTPLHVDWLKRFTSNIDRGYVVHCPDGDAFTGAPFPKVLYVDYPEDSPTCRRGVGKHVALLNWFDEAQYVGATTSQLGLTGPLTARNFWTDEQVEIPAEGICRLLPRRAALLLEIPTT